MWTLPRPRLLKLSTRGSSPRVRALSVSPCLVPARSAGALYRRGLGADAHAACSRQGVYYGWARLSSESGAAHPMVLNVGERPTFADGAGLSVEAHVLHEYAADFYDEEMRLLVCGAARPEQRFDGLEALVAQIHADIAGARDALAAPACARWRDDALFE